MYIVYVMQYFARWDTVSDKKIRPYWGRNYPPFLIFRGELARMYMYVEGPYSTMTAPGFGLE